MAGDANHAPFLERFATERLIAAAAILGLLAAVPSSGFCASQDISWHQAFLAGLFSV